MSTLHILFEHATGYALFRTVKFEEVAMFLPQVESAVNELSTFRSIVNLVGFMPFKTSANSLDNINSISEGVVHSDLRLFLETNVPKSSKKHPVLLGVGDAKIGSSIQDELGISCQHTGVVPEIIRGIRLHFPNLVKGLTDQSASKAQLGLGHSYSRARVKFNINKVDNMVIQSISLLDQMDKDINTFAMRVREWYSYHFPELVKIVSDNYSYAKVAKFIKNRKDVSPEMFDALEELTMDSAKAQAIIDAARSSMGMDISPIDLLNIETFANRVISLVEYRKELMEYLKTKMGTVAPNLATLVGDTVGARLISHAGSLINLAKFPASTVQILGAEKALFRALKTRGNTPKYGLIFHSTFIGRAAAKNKGRISRYLANKCSIASRIDCFGEVSNTVFGEKLKEQVEERLKFYEKGDIPRKNADVMKSAMELAAQVKEKSLKKQKKKDKKEKKKKEALLNSMNTTNESMNTTTNSVASNEEEEMNADDSNKKKKKKKKKDLEGESSVNEETFDAHSFTSGDEIGDSQKKKKKRKSNVDSSFNSTGIEDSFSTQDETQVTPNGEPPVKKLKKKKKKMKEME